MGNHPDHAADGIPGTAVVVGFNAQFGEIVSPRMARVAGIRNALHSVISTVFTLISGLSSTT